MLFTIATALLPVLLALLLGVLAGARKEFSGRDASVLTRMVMHYALPMTLFAHVSSMTRAVVLAHLPLAGLLVAGLMGPFLGIYFCCRLWDRFHSERRTCQQSDAWALRDLKATNSRRAMLYALAVSTPSIPFVGVPVLGELYGASSGLIVSIGGLVINLVQVPIALFVLTPVPDPTGNPTDFLPKRAGFRAHLAGALKEPVVWAPLLALTLVMAGIELPILVRQPLRLLGQATGGTALFATGIVLQTRHVMLSPRIAVAVLARNLVIPLGMLGLLALWGVSSALKAETAVTLALPSAAIATILAVSYKLGEREAASILFFSTLFSAFSLPLLLWCVS